MNADTTAALAKLKTALEAFASIRADDGDDFSGWPDDVVIRCEVTAGDIKAAREALPALLSALESAHDEAIEEAAAIADRWAAENKAAEAKAFKTGRSRYAFDGDETQLVMAEQLAGAAVECNAIAHAIRDLKVHPNAD